MSGGHPAAEAAAREVAGKYRIVGFLGAGASGETFEATDVCDGVTVALKRLVLAQAREWKAIELFQREVEILGRIQHPAVPRTLAKPGSEDVALVDHAIEELEAVRLPFSK